MVEIDFRGFSRQELEEVGVEMAPHLLRGLQMIPRFLEAAMAAPQEVQLEVPVGQLRRQRDRCREQYEATGDPAYLDRARKLEIAAEAQEMFKEFRHELHCIDVQAQRARTKHQERVRAEEIARREAARAAGQQDVIRELNRERHKAAGRVRKKE
jgi:hypothetical protein